MERLKVTLVCLQVIIICLLTSLYSEAQQDTTAKPYGVNYEKLPPYWINYEYVRDKCKKSITFEAMPIRLPYAYFQKAFPYPQDSVYSFTVSEEDKEQVKVRHGAYAIWLHTSYTWESHLWRGLITSRASAWLSVLGITDGRRREVSYEELDSLLDHNDSLRYKICSTLRQKHEAYVLKRTGLDFNVPRLLEKVTEVKLVVSNHGEEFRKVVIFKNDTISMMGDVVMTLNQETKTQLLSLLGKDSELMTRYATMSFFPDHELLLSDNDNNYLGKIKIAGCGGNSLELKINDEFVYFNTSEFYKNCEAVNALIVAALGNKKKKR